MVDVLRLRAWQSARSRAIASAAIETASPVTSPSVSHRTAASPPATQHVSRALRIVLRRRTPSTDTDRVRALSACDVDGDPRRTPDDHQRAKGQRACATRMPRYAEGFELLMAEGW
jgi:hypothetical protein